MRTHCSSCPIHSSPYRYPRLCSPKFSRSIAAANLDEARHDLVSALNNVGLLIMFFAAAMVVFPEPIIRALLPSVSMDETMLISYALIALSVGIPLGSAFLLIQRTFYAFEDGLHPFLSAVMQYGFTSIFMIIGMMVLPPEHWVLGIACSVTLGGLLALPLTLMMLRRKFEGNLGGRRSRGHMPRPLWRHWLPELWSG